MHRWKFHVAGLFLVVVAMSISYGALPYLGGVTKERIAVFLVIQAAAVTGLLSLIDALKHLPPQNEPGGRCTPP